MINEEIIGGLVSALSRGQSLESAMMTFYNAGYNKDEIEDSAKEVYNQIGAQKMGINGTLQDALNDIAVKAGVPTTTAKPEEKPSEQPKSDMEKKIVLQSPPEKKLIDSAPSAKPEDKSSASNINPNQPYTNSSDITNKIEEAIKGLRPVNIPSKIEIVHKNIDEKSPTVVQHVSDYSSQKTISKSLTYVLVAILILLLIALGAVFLFKDDLIKLFNNLGLA
ncbi:MAG: hypothetical protein ACP5NZ_04715 [Nanobdellota archaeon]